MCAYIPLYCMLMLFNCHSVNCYVKALSSMLMVTYKWKPTPPSQEEILHENPPETQENIFIQRKTESSCLTQGNWPCWYLSVGRAILPACGTPPSFQKVFHKAHLMQWAARSVSNEYRTDQGFFGGSVQHRGSAAQHTPTAPTCSHLSQAHFTAFSPA